jgi:ankyrin repeat protein
LGIPELSVDAKDVRGKTAFFYAVENGNIEMMQRILDHCRVNLNVRDCNGNDGLVLAAVRNGNLECLSFLLALNGIDPNLRNAQGDFPLSVAVRKGNDEIVHLLCCHDAIDINQADPAGVLSLLFVELHFILRHRQQIKLLLD